MKLSPFDTYHKMVGAKMIVFAGWEMPAYYTSIREEHYATRNDIGLFDVSHMSEFIVEGEHALEWLDYMTPNRMDTLTKGKAQYSALLNTNGCFVDDILIYGIAPPTRYMIVGNAANREKDKAWMLQYKFANTKLVDVSDQTCLLALQGPKSSFLLQELCSERVDAIPYYRFIRGKVAGVDDVLISATGYTGEKGFELYFENKTQDNDAIWTALREKGKKYGLKVAGLGCRDTLRLEMAYPLYGNDIDETYHIAEANLMWIVKTKYKQAFIGREAIEALHTPTRTRIGFMVEGKGIARPNQNISNLKGEQIGVVTSATVSPTLDKAIGMGYCGTEVLQNTDTIYIEQPTRKLSARIVDLPFLKK